MAANRRLLTAELDEREAVMQLFTRTSKLAREKAALEQTNRRLEIENARLRQLVYEDPLTGLGNRRYFDRVLAAELARAARCRGPLTLLICDVDRFKQCNDTYGHDFGDTLLVEIARVLERACRRGGDHAVRFAGDEFALLLPGLTRADAEPFAEHVRRAVAAVSIRCPRTRAVPHVTLSIGGATRQGPEACPPTMLLKTADEALYRAKAAGRDMTAFSP